MLKEVIFSQRNEYTPLYIKTNLLRRKFTKNKQLLDNILKYLPLETETLEETENLLIQESTTYRHSHPFIESSPDLSEYIPFTQCKICGDNMLFHKYLRNKRKNHSLTKSRHSFASFPKKEDIMKSNNNIIRCKSPSLKSKGIVSYFIETFECDICMELKPKEERVDLQCSHFFCRSCVYEHIENAIINNKVPIKCPDGSCGLEFLDEFVELYVNEESFKKYKKFMRRYNISLIQNAVYCPIPNCESYALKPESVNDDNNTNLNNTEEQTNVDVNINVNSKKKRKKLVILKCLENDHEFCMNCRQKPHKGRDCDLKEEKGWMVFKKENHLKKCPKCGIEIYKDSGCNHMTCTKCQYQFCWICGMKYTSSSHYNNPLLPCFRMQFTNQRSILVTNPCIRALKVIGFILLFLIALPIALIFSEMIGMGVGIYFLFEEYSRGFRCFPKVVYFITLIFLGIALVSYGYVLTIVAILGSPVILSYVITQLYY